jgi:hypothetical protein
VQEGRHCDVPCLITRVSRCITSNRIYTDASKLVALQQLQKTRLAVISTLLLLAAFAPSAALAQTAGSNSVSSSVTTTSTTTVQSCPPASTAFAVIGSVKLPVTVCVVDSFGNIYSITVSGIRSSYSLRGQLVSSPYLLDTPWNVYGNGKGTSFNWVSVDSVQGNGDCNWRVMATITPPTASGSWVNPGCGHETGTLTLAACTASSCTSGSIGGPNENGRPGA